MSRETFRNKQRLNSVILKHYKGLDVRKKIKFNRKYIHKVTYICL